MKRALIFSLFCAFCLHADILTNPDFEGSVPAKVAGYRKTILPGWEILLNSGVGKVDAELSTEAFSGSQSLCLLSLVPRGFVSAQAVPSIAVQVGEVVQGKVMIKGQGAAYIRFYYLDADGKRLPENGYHMHGLKADPERWQELATRFTVPEGVAAVIFSVQMLREGKILCDAAEVICNRDTILANEHLHLKVNPLCGGVIDSLQVQGNDFDFTRGNSRQAVGGLAADIIPGQRTPGLCRYEVYELNRPTPEKQELTLRRLIDMEPLAGLEVSKTFKLLPQEPTVEVRLTLRNTTEAAMQVNTRTQNIVSANSGVFSWPHPDWVQIFRQEGPITSLNNIVLENFRAGWVARWYKEQKMTLLFNFEAARVEKNYTYLSDRLSTMEWYYRDLELAPGQSWSTDYQIKILLNTEDFYADERGRTQRVEEIVPKEMPPPPMAAVLPERLQGFFPYGSSLGNLMLPEMVGAQGGSQRLFRLRSELVVRDYAAASFNCVSSGRFAYDATQEAFWNEDGTHMIGEMAKELNLKLIPSRLMLHREDLEVNAYREKLEKNLAMLKTEPVRKFLHQYSDLILCFFTADEILPMNVEPMLLAHREMGKLMSPEILPFPYLNSSSRGLMPYLPVFLGDFYPIKREGYSGRNPWSVYREFSSLVQIAGETPVWIMPQAFGYRFHTYAMPTAGEMRLMLNLAVAAGVRGIIFYGFTNGGWGWRLNYYHDYAALGAAGQRTEAWQAIVECGQVITAIGGELWYAKPAPLPEGVTLSTTAYKSANGFYQGDALKAFALISDRATFLLVVNHDPDNEHQGQLVAPQELFDLVTDQQLGKNVPLTIKPGGAKYLLLGEAPETRKNIAAARKIRQEAAQLALSREPQGIEEIRKILDRVDFALTRHLEHFVTPEMREQTPRYRRWVPNPDADLEDIMKRIAADFYEMNRLRREPDAKAEEVEQLAAKVKVDAARFDELVQRFVGSKLIDDPYER